MRILVAEDGKGVRRRLEKVLAQWGFEVEPFTDGKSAWERVETYITRFSEVGFSHSICPDCCQEHVKPMLEQRKKGGES